MRIRLAIRGRVDVVAAPGDNGSIGRVDRFGDVGGDAKE